MTFASFGAPRVEVLDASGTWDTFVGQVITMTLPRAFAPGNPMSIRVRLRVASGEEREMTLGAKAVNSRKRGEAFEVIAKLHGLTREQRLLAQAYFGIGKEPGAKE